MEEGRKEGKEERQTFFVWDIFPNTRNSVINRSNLVHIITKSDYLVSAFLQYKAL